MRPEITETVKRLEPQPGISPIGYRPYLSDVQALIAELQRVSLELVFANARIVERNAEIARLSAPVGPWRTGRQVTQNIYEGDAIRLQAHTPEQAERIVRLLNLGSAAE